MKMKNKIQITEEQAKMMLIDCSIMIESRFFLKAINFWKEKGYIKKSKLDEARAYYNEYINVVIKSGNVKIAFDELMTKYEEAIEEIKEKNRP
jgi:hypothetical protein